MLSPAGITSIGCHKLSPGMVLTDLLLEGSSPVARRFFNTLAEEPETVAAALVPQIKAIQVPCVVSYRVCNPSLQHYACWLSLGLASSACHRASLAAIYNILVCSSLLSKGYAVHE